MSFSETIKRLTGYKAWANEITFSAVTSLPKGEATKERETRFGNIVHTLNHVYVIDCIFKAHLEKTTHPYTARNTEISPPLEELWQSVKLVDQWYIDYAHSVSEKELLDIVNFQFVDGDAGTMSRSEIILHVVNHGTYHRGLVSDMMYQVPAVSPANDLTVYLRDVIYSSKMLANQNSRRSL
ncbi:MULTISPECIES: DinB family protein [Cyanophyceae]|uniref:DinB family protein n=1 Tax=Cyanophyceae TaxID=3028117 RepID=UPI0016830F69|nr:MULTISPECIES: DinB family protein [Cyanophyceae]MBD1918328.1 DinB family protein [Phormidium sp. FACHB-77]MBD2028803.1 DinB family protein [Phormidium sp. FACHB-322]MBD2051224.1 DinB family protein [Leptolyngbya sp. FACHB-60]